MRSIAGIPTSSIGTWSSITPSSTFVLTMSIPRLPSHAATSFTNPRDDANPSTASHSLSVSDRPTFGGYTRLICKSASPIMSTRRNAWMESISSCVRSWAQAFAPSICGTTPWSSASVSKIQTSCSRPSVGTILANSERTATPLAPSFAPGIGSSVRFSSSSRSARSLES